MNGEDEDIIASLDAMSQEFLYRTMAPAPEDEMSEMSDAQEPHKGLQAPHTPAHEPAQPAHGGSMSPAEQHAAPRYPHNRIVSNYFCANMSKQVRCRECGDAKATYHCRLCSCVVDTKIRCLKHVVAVCMSCRAAHGVNCRPGAAVKTCIEAGLYYVNSCKLCRSQMDLMQRDEEMDQMLL